MATRGTKSPARGAGKPVEARAKAGAKSSAFAAAGGRFLLDDEAQRAVEARYPEGITSAQIVAAFTGSGVRLTEATFRKWVQIGLLPRSRRVGRKGKHQGSLGLYPPETVRRIAAVKRLMGESLTIEDIARSLRFRDEIEAVERGLRDLFRGFAEALGAEGQAASGLPETERQKSERLLAQIEKQSGEFMRRIGTLERRIVEPFEREAKARAFGSGTSGGAGDLL